MSKRRRKEPRMRNRINTNGNDGDLGKINGATPVPAETTQERIPAAEGTWEAVQIHELRAENCDLQAKVLERDQLVIKKDQIILALREKLLGHEKKSLASLREKANELNTKLRADHDIRVGGKLHKDDDTGQVFWLVDKPEA